LVELAPIRKMERSRDTSRRLGPMWKKLIKRGEKVELELSRAEHKLLLTGLVFLHAEVEAAIRSTPPGKPVKISLSDLDDLAGHVAGEANHAKSQRTEEVLSGLFEKIEELLALYVEDSGPARGGMAPPTKSAADRLMDEKPAILPIHPEPNRGDGDDPH
jgi:hypothetical protein